ncbi:MAG: acyl-CoA reductase [Chitinophagaceae bacterium]|nr:MAG: acyl-CoA reductase [Chitinophagaceae bacterium]
MRAALTGIAHLLAEPQLSHWAGHYPAEPPTPRQVGVVMAGNIPLVGFHDFLCVFLSGHKMTIKLSSRDKILITGLVNEMTSLVPELAQEIVFSEMLKGCDAYIATGSNNSSRYFEYYFAKYPHIIRRNRTSAAVLSGAETKEELELLADDVYTYFGLGCRNVTKLYVPEGYDFVPLLEAFKKYNFLFEHHKFKNNYDYQLALLLINKEMYMSNGSLLLRANKSLFSPIGVLNYEFYDEPITLKASLATSDEVQCVVAHDQLPFGDTQKPTLTDFADGVDTLQFLLSF